MVWDFIGRYCGSFFFFYVRVVSVQNLKSSGMVLFHFYLLCVSRIQGKPKGSGKHILGFPERSKKEYMLIVRFR